MSTTIDYYNYIMDCLAKYSGITSRKMMGEYLIYYHGKLIGELCDNRFLVKQSKTSNRLLIDCPLEYPYEGSKTLMYVVDDIENIELLSELIEGLYRELPDKKIKKKN